MVSLILWNEVIPVVDLQLYLKTYPLDLKTSLENYNAYWPVTHTSKVHMAVYDLKLRGIRIFELCLTYLHRTFLKT